MKSRAGMNNEPEGQQPDDDQFPLSKESLPASGGSLAGVPRDLIDQFSTQQVLIMRKAGAIFPEKLECPLVIRHPDQREVRPVILTTRWLAGGLFGGMLIGAEGELCSTSVFMKDAMASNPGLTPRGTYTPAPWHESRDAYKTYVLPSSSTIREGGIAVANEVAKTLLKEFPYRIDLLSERERHATDRERVKRIFQQAQLKMFREISTGLDILSVDADDSQDVRLFFESGLNLRLREILVEKALPQFVTAQASTALDLYDRGVAKGFIHDLICDSAKKASILSKESISESLRKLPFAAPSSDECEQIGSIGVQAAVDSSDDFKVLITHIPSDKAAKIKMEIGRKAWLQISSDYFSSN